MKKDLMKLDRFISRITTRATNEKDLNELKTILRKHLKTLGGDYLLIPEESLELPEVELDGFSDIELEPLDVELSQLNIDLDEGLILDPCPKTRPWERENDN